MDRLNALHAEALRENAEYDRYMAQEFPEDFGDYDADDEPSDAEMRARELAHAVAQCRCDSNGPCEFCVAVAANAEVDLCTRVWESL